MDVASEPGQRRAERNDELVRRSIVDVLCERGWAGLTLRNVAARANVARHTVTARHPTRTAMAVTAWRNAFGAPLHQALEGLLAAHDLVARTTPSDPESSWRWFSEPTCELRGALELLLQAPFEAELATAINATLGPEATGWTTHNRRTRPRRQATQRGFLIARALGLLAMGSINDLSDVDFAPAERATHEALLHPARVLRIPLDPPPHVTVETGDARHDALLATTIEHVARLGYEGASIDAICADAGITKGFVFNRYATKQALFIDAARRRQHAAIASSSQWLDRLSSRRGRAVAEATFVRAVLHPTRHVDRCATREEYRLAMHEPELAQAYADTARKVSLDTFGTINPTTLGYAYSARALGEGIGLLTLIEPDAWQLPFEVVLAPLQEAWTRAYLGTS